MPNIFQLAKSVIFADDTTIYITGNDKMLYHTLVYPHLTYGTTIWGGTHKTHTHKLKIKQKKIIRIINSSTKYDAHSEPIFKHIDR